MNKLAIFGANGHGKVVAELAELIGFDVFFYDDCFPLRKTVEHWPIYGNLTDLLDLKTNCFSSIVAIGNNSVREKVIKKLEYRGFNIPVLIHPSVVISKHVCIGAGSVLLPGVVVNAFASIGKGCILNTSVVVEHDCDVGDYTHLAPNACIAGGVKIGSNSFLGIGSKVIQMRIIGSHSIIGAGSTVISDLPDNVTAIGTPAAILLKG
ncbi:probable pilin glycosylation protein [Marinomonas sp. MED121]|uniref:acetyltransferase n=1 Tax=Marinomonas sp. MED121 TaxID=314277 RepID=UPI0000690091|nr:acetyltransferase [Marinomonas sp. MED121]EAQ65687.1 probable pilin glycosylation protein [Marinomonas sp. MED121]